MTTLGKLVCGKSDHIGNARGVLDHISETIDLFAERGLRYLKEDFDENARLYGAFCARVILENSCAALVGRLDTFRLLYLREFQVQEDFDYGLSSNSGFKWSSDVLAKDQPKDMWGVTHDATKVNRALFSQYTEHLLWKPAFDLTLDKIAQADISEAISRRINGLTSDIFIDRMKGECKRLYSKLSKGVHWEFFEARIIMDEDTLKDAIRECLEITSILGLVSHFIPAAYHCVSADEALNDYVEFRGEML